MSRSVSFDHPVLPGSVATHGISEYFNNGNPLNTPATAVESPFYENFEHDHVTTFPNRWAKIRSTIKEVAAEFLGTMILVIFGNGVNCQAVLSSNTKVTGSPQGDPGSVALGWAAGIALGVWISASHSGGHINPAVTISMASFRGFPWRKVPVYIASQIAGAFTGALLIYANYVHAIDAFEGKGIRTVPGTAGLFATFAQSYETNAAAFFDEFFGTFLLVLVILTVTDKANGPTRPGLVPLAVGVALLGLTAALGMNTAFALNPARDLGPRLMTWIFYGKAVWNYRNQYWIWCPLIGPILGALVAALIYDAFLFTGSESIFNMPSKTQRLPRIRSSPSVTGKKEVGETV